MSNSRTKGVVSPQHAVLENGVIVVGRCFSSPTEPYCRERLPDYLSLVDHSLKLKKKQYKKALFREETEFNTLVRQLGGIGKSLIIAFQGRDGAGKSGAAQRIMQAVDCDPKLFLWVPIGPPTEEERAHPYLWRFFTGERMPKLGQIRVFDRCWMERVLVEPVMHLVSKKDTQRSYAELRTFEWLLNSQGAVIVKFWFDITKHEQLVRFKARGANKPWKLSPSDREARKHWDEYTLAANEMFHRTGTEYAPWHILSSEDKRYSRVTVLQVINQRLKEALHK